MNQLKWIFGVLIISTLALVLLRSHTTFKSATISAMPQSPQFANSAGRKSPVAVDIPDRSSVRATTERIGTVVEETGHTGESNDFVVAVMRHADLNLSPSETKALLSIYIDTVRKRTSHEASISTVNEVNANEKIIRVPKYAEEGAKLQADFYQRIAQTIGDVRAVKLRDYIGTELYVRNFGFGHADQIINVKLAGAPEMGAIYEIAHSVSELNVGEENATDKFHQATISLGSMRSVLPISNLGSYTAFAKVFPVGQ